MMIPDADVASKVFVADDVNINISSSPKISEHVLHSDPDLCSQHPSDSAP